MISSNSQNLLQITSKITTAEFAAKFKSKKEVYYFLVVDVQAFLPSYQTVTIYFLKDLVNGTKKCKSIFFKNYLIPINNLFFRFKVK